MRGYLAAMRSYATFSGRASRFEYWMFTLGYGLALIGALVADVAISGPRQGGEFGPIIGIVQLAHIIPSIAVLVRRLHDIDRTGHWLWIVLTGVGAIVLLVFTLLPSTKGPNRYGPQPGAEPIGEAPRPAYHVAPQPQEDVTVQLERLSALKRDGAISDAEFQALKGKLLAS